MRKIMKNLAINGGTPLFQNNEFKVMPWPPVSESTADKLREIYMSRQWSFNSPTEQEFEKEFKKL